MHWWTSLATRIRKTRFEGDQVNLNVECSLPENRVEGLAQNLNLEFKSQAWALIAKSKSPEKIKCTHGLWQRIQGDQVL